MINVSEEFRELMNTRTDFKEYAEITFADGTLLELSQDVFTITNNGIVDAADVNGVPLGVALCRSIQMELMNDDERFSTYDFFGAKIRLYLTFQLSNTVERIEYGTFTVLTPETYGETVIISALDDMYKADVDYITSLAFPADLKSILVDACNAIGISLGTTSFLNDDFVVEVAPAGITYRQLFGYIAMIAGGNARIDLTGRLRIITYDFSVLDSIHAYIDGGAFKPWSEGDVLDGGTFNPWNIGDAADGGLFSDRSDIHVLYKFKDLKVDTDDVVITGIRASYTDDENEEQAVMYGADGYVLNVQNPLITGKEREAVGLIGNVMVGGRFRQFSADMVADPTCEFMDYVILVDRKGNTYASFLTDINFQFFGFTTVKNSAATVLRNSSKSYSAAIETLVTARKLIKKERAARETAVAQLAKDLANSSGLFMTKEEQEDGSFIYYMHDKPTLAESMIIWKLTSLAFGISTDGGKTYPYGFTVNGELITRLLYAEGIDADYIDTGAIRITDTAGNVLFLADYNTKQVQINADKVLIGSRTVKEYVDSVNDETVGLLKSYSTTIEMNSAISTKANEINLAVSKTYETITDSEEKCEELSGKITVNANAITAEVKRAQGQETELAAAISVATDQIALKVSKGEISSQLSVESGAISIKSNRFSWESTYSSLSATGKLTATDVDLSGKITASSGKIGGFTVGTTSIYNSKSSLEAKSSGVYIGTDGISVGYGKSFVVDQDGNIYLGLDTDIEVGGVLKFNNAAWNGIKYNSYEIFTINSSTHAMEVKQDIISTGSLTLNGSITLDGTYDFTISSSQMKFDSYSGTYYFKDYSNNNLISFSRGALSLGYSSGKLGFFGSSGATKKIVPTIASTSSATASTIATKVNELINALYGYGLIG